MATEAAAPPPSPPARRLSTPKPLDVVADHAASCGDLIRPKSLVEEVRARQAAAARAWNGHDLVSLGDGAPKRRRDRRSFHGRTALEVERARPVHSVMHELRCFFDPAYRLHQIRMSMKTTMRQRDMGCVELFKYYDADGSGTVDKDELSAAVRSSLQLTIRQSEVDTLMDQIDKDGNGDVDTDEFAAWLFAPGEEPWLDDERRYGEDDPHGDKILLARDMARFDPVVMKLLDAFWRVCDTNGNGQIDVDEYLARGSSTRGAGAGRGPRRRATPWRTRPSSSGARRPCPTGPSGCRARTSASSATSSSTARAASSSSSPRTAP